MKRTDLVRHLERHNCRLLREGSKHTIYYNKARNLTTSVPRHREIKNPTASKICQQLGVPAPTK